MHVHFWGTRGSIPTPGHRTAIYGGNTSCVEIRLRDGANLILDCGTGVRMLGLDMLRRDGPQCIHLLISHTHWDHIQGFPFFTPAFLPANELNIYGSTAFQRSLEDSLSGQMQYSYFPVKLQDLASRIHYTELEEGFFRIGDALVETQYLNHTAPAIGYRISADGATVVYVNDHEPFWNAGGSGFRHPGDQRHIEFLRGADLVIHDTQYTPEEYRSKLGWGHSPADYVADVAVAANVAQLAFFHHDPLHDDETIKRMEETQRARVHAAGSTLDIFAAAEGMALDVTGKGRGKTIVHVSALERRPIEGARVMLVTPHQADIAAVQEVLAEDDLRVTAATSCRSAIETADALPPDLVIINSKLYDGEGAALIQPLRDALRKPELPVILLTEDFGGGAPAGSRAATDYLARPFSPPMLRTRVRAWLARTIAATGAPIRVVVPDHLTDGNGCGAASTAEDLRRLVASIPIFAPLTLEQRLQLLGRSIEQNFPADHTVIRQGDSMGIVYVILSGHVRVFESVPDSPVEMFLGELGHGQIFGELGVLRERPRSATIVTLEPTRCLAIPAPDFLHLLGECKELSLAVLRILAGRLYDADRLLARHAPDPLTGLPGRRAFNELYRKLVAGAKRRRACVLLLVVDILHLKQINDQYGHSAGDDVLRAVADALIESSRGADLVTRYGGDEFTLLLIDAGETEADSVVQRIQQKLGQLTISRNLPVTIECRMGFAVSYDPPENGEEFLRAADSEMQRGREALLN